MQTENAWIVVLILLLVVIGANLAAFGMVRSARGDKNNWMRNIQNGANTLLKQDKEASELSERMRELRNKAKEKEETS